MSAHFSNPKVSYVNRNRQVNDYLPPPESVAVDSVRNGYSLPEAGKPAPIALQNGFKVILKHQYRHDWLNDNYFGILKISKKTKTKQMMPTSFKKLPDIPNR